MNSAGKAGQIRELLLWDRHRATIERLYLKENKGLNVIDTYMRKHHSFFASKSQYEKHFKKWRLRKNLTAPEWRAIIRYIKEKVLNPNEIDVIFNGSVLSKDRIEREKLRYGPSAISHDACKLPYSVEIIPSISRMSGKDATTACSSAHHLEVIGLASDSSGTMSRAVTTLSNKSYPPATDKSRWWSDGPYSWTMSLNTDHFVHASSPSQHLTTRVSKSSNNAALYPSEEMLKSASGGGASNVFLLSLITTLSNNTKLGRDTKATYAYEVFKLIPRPALLRIRMAHPSLIHDTLIERVFAAAIIADDGEAVSAMLALNAKPHEHIRMNDSSQPERMHPLEFAVCQRQYSAAEALLAHICKDATQDQADEFLGYIFTQKQRKYRKSSEEPEMIELMCPILAAGAHPVARCFHKDYWGHSPLAIIKRLFEAGNTDITEWLRLGLLQEVLTAYSGDVGDKDGAAVTKKLLRYILLEKLPSHSMGNLNLGLAFLDALRTAEQRHPWAIELILPTMWNFGYDLDDDLAGKFIANEPFNRACIDAQWTLGAELMLGQIQFAEWLQSSKARPSPPKRDKIEILEELIQSIKGYIARNEFTHICKLLEDDMLWDKSWQRELIVGLCDRVEQALRLDRPRVAATIIQEIGHRKCDGLQAILVLFRHSQTTIATSLLQEDETWSRALEAATIRHDFSLLENLIHRHPHHTKDLARDSNAIFSLQGPERRQMYLRLISFYATEMENKNLCRWLFELGMDASELIHAQDITLKADIVLDIVAHRPITHNAGGLPGGFPPTWRWDYDYKDHILPSLVTIAVEQDRVSWLRFLLTQRVDVRDSMALFRAVEIGAEAATIHCLLEAAKAQKHPGGPIYGSAALRKAIRYRDSELIDTLCEFVDIDAIERSTKEYLKDENVLSPMGEAIAMKNPDLVAVLLKHGADPNKCVAHEAYQFGKIQSVLPRITPSIAAIDMQSLPIVQQLVDAGGEVYYKQALGMFRTPIQRAAEVGNLEILRYLLSKGAQIDTHLKYNGGTELQLAAMNGFVGIATFLIEIGADVNHPPAEGQGRTAFEAAAEHGQSDMVSLLMQSGVQLNLKFGAPSESQFIRAQRFAKENGYMAVARYVESLATTYDIVSEEQPLEELQPEDLQSWNPWPSPGVRKNNLLGVSP